MAGWRWLAGLGAIALALAACAGDGSTGTGTDAVPAADASREAASGNVTDGCVEGYDPAVDYFPDKVAADHARGWDVRYEGNYKVVRAQVTAAAGHAAAADRVLEGTYVLVQCGTEPPPLEGDLAGATVVEVPVRTFVDGGSIFYAAVEQLGVADALTGHAEPFFGEVEAPYLPEVAERIEAGEVREVGYEVNLEVLAETAPDFYTNYAGDDTMFEQIRGLGIPVVLYFPYSETPLGAAEHLEFLSLFFNLEARAGEILAPIQERYLELRAEIDEHAATLAEPPTVLIGVLGDDGMTTRERERFEPELVRAAGAEPVPDLPGGGISTIAVESAYELAASADFWLDLAFFRPGETAADYLEGDPRVANIPALAAGNAFSRIGPRGYDYFLHGALEADVILADLASILHPDLLGDHEPEFLGPIPAQ